ncbi:MAG: hypothetical protein K2L59_04185 [Muribaculaceae bacterium]|nr:hypothetical protein [Muribaculaceae bacterium]MDE6392451.1 hypothetical protein [Muribaculaceae bacterium]
MLTSLSILILITFIVIAVGKLCSASGDTAEKEVDRAEEQLVISPATQQKMQQIRERIDRLTQEIEEEKAREREYERLKAETEENDRLIAVLERITAQEQSDEAPSPEPDLLKDISQN